MHDLYRLWNQEGELLYIGESFSAIARMSGHKKDKPWWPEVTSITITRYPGRDTARAAEKAAIKAEHPRYNKTHNDTTPSDPQIHRARVTINLLDTMANGRFFVSTSTVKNFLGISHSTFHRHKDTLPFQPTMHGHYPVLDLLKYAGIDPIPEIVSLMPTRRVVENLYNINRRAAEACTNVVVGPWGAA